MAAMIEWSSHNRLFVLLATILVVGRGLYSLRNKKLFINNQKFKILPDLPSRHFAHNSNN